MSSKYLLIAGMFTFENRWRENCIGFKISCRSDASPLPSSLIRTLAWQSLRWQSLAVAPEKLQRIVNDIATLNLLEVAELNKLLKTTLNIADAPVMAYGGALPLAAKQEEEEEEAAPVKVQTSFTVKLLKFEDTKKVGVIKELKNLVEGMNLVQAKKFVESAPAVVKADIAKDEAEKLMAALTAAGATCEIV
nr:EOG090X0O3H [Lepidurus arcticus]